MNRVLHVAGWAVVPDSFVDQAGAESPRDFVDWAGTIGIATLRQFAQASPCVTRRRQALRERNRDR